MDRFGGRALERQFGSDSAMRGWYPPDRITALGLVRREISHYVNAPRKGHVSTQREGGHQQVRKRPSSEPSHGAF